MASDRTVIAVVVAAGWGARLGLDMPKALVMVAGHPMLYHSLAAIGAAPSVDAVVVVAPPGHLTETEGLTRDAPARAAMHAVVPGGETRQESVRRGLEACPGADVVLVHDAARPLVSSDLFGRVLHALDGPAVGAVPVVAVHDTVKRVRDGVVVETVPRAEIGLAQTPQAFAAEQLREAHRRADERGDRATDDAMLLEVEGLRVVAVPGEPENFKVTTAEDLRRAEEILRAR